MVIECYHALTRNACSDVTFKRPSGHASVVLNRQAGTRLVLKKGGKKPGKNSAKPNSKRKSKKYSKGCLILLKNMQNYARCIKLL